MTLTTRLVRLALNRSPSGAFVYRLGHGPLKAERRVRFPYALPTFNTLSILRKHRIETHFLRPPKKHHNWHLPTFRRHLAAYQSDQ